MIKFIKLHKNEFIVGIACSLLVSVFFYIAGMQKIDIQYSINTYPIASSSIGKKIKFHEDEYNNISVTNITVTNKGNIALNGKTMLKKAPLQINIDKNFQIIEAYKQDRQTTKNVDYSLVISQNCITIPFETINPKNKISFSVIHTGYTNDDIYLSGEWENYNGITRNNPIKFGLTIIIVLSLLLLVAIVYIIVSDKKNKKYLDWIEHQLDIILEEASEDEKSN